MRAIELSCDGSKHCLDNSDEDPGCYKVIWAGPHGEVTRPRSPGKDFSEDEKIDSKHNSQLDQQKKAVLSDCYSSTGR